MGEEGVQGLRCPWGMLLSLFFILWIREIL